MYCDNAQFNPYDLSGFSEENELGISYNCVSNMLKVCVFSVYLIIFFVLSLYSLAGLLREYVRNPHWNASKRRFTCTFLVALAYMGLLPIFITGTFKRGKYILFPFTFWPIFIAAGASIAEWYKASKLMEKSGNSMKEETMAVLNKIYYAFQVIQGSGFFLWWAILPMIFFDNPWILNWVFICGYVHTGLVLIFVCLFGFKVANVLLNTIRPHLAETLVDKKIVSFVEGLETFLKRIKVAAAALSPVLLLIIWVPLTQTATNPGLDYFFYFEFFVTIPIKFMMILIINKVAWRDLQSIGTRHSSNGSHGSHGSHGSNPDSGDRKKSKDFSYSADELNGNVVVDMQQV